VQLLSTLVQLLVTTALIWAGLSLLYHYGLAIAGRRQPQRHPDSGNTLRFAVLIPAHNEAAVIASTLAAINALEYPSDLYDAIVIADHCTDDTPELARASGALCLERTDGLKGRKAYPLRWAIERVLHSTRQYDAFVVIDADSRLDGQFLSRIRDAMATGNEVLQGQHLLSNAGDSAYTRVADADMRINNLVRNQAKRNLGLSARLMGDAMCFSRRVLYEHGWPVDSMGEDREFGMYLCARGIRVHYVPEAISRGQAALHWRDANRQRLRWQAGANQLRRSQLGALWRAALRDHSAAALDLVAELVLPSYSLATLLPAVSLALLALLGSPLHLLLAWAALALLGLAGLFPFAALYSARAPVSTYQGVLLGPLFVVWRLLQKARSVLLPSSIRWIRTARSEESKP